MEVGLEQRFSAVGTARLLLLLPVSLLTVVSGRWSLSAVAVVVAEDLDTLELALDRVLLVERLPATDAEQSPPVKWLPWLMLPPSSSMSKPIWS